MQVDHRLHPKPSLKELQVGGNLDLDSFNTHGISIHTDTGDPRIMEKSLNPSFSHQQLCYIYW